MGASPWWLSHVDLDAWALIQGWFILPTASKGALGPSCVVSLS